MKLYYFLKLIHAICYFAEQKVLNYCWNSEFVKRMKRMKEKENNVKGKKNNQVFFSLRIFFPFSFNFLSDIPLFSLKRNTMYIHVESAEKRR